jgi:hypothetical protein
MPNPAISRIEHPSNREVVFSRLLDAPQVLQGGTQTLDRLARYVEGHR